MRHVLVFTSLIFLMLSCTSDDVCLRSKANPLQVGLYAYKLDTLGQAKKIAVEVQAITLLLSDAKSDTFIDRRAGQSRFYAPLDPLKNRTSFVLWIDSAQSTPDTIYIQYTASELFLDLACGVAYEFEIDSAYSNRFRIDSVLISNPKLKLNNSDENLQLIF